MAPNASGDAPLGPAPDHANLPFASTAATVDPEERPFVWRPVSPEREPLPKLDAAVEKD
jgi:hypothetical protein